jgi:hypothetical protein
MCVARKPVLDLAGAEAGQAVVQAYRGATPLMPSCLLVTSSLAGATTGSGGSSWCGLRTLARASPRQAVTAPNERVTIMIRAGRLEEHVHVSTQLID